MVVSVGWYHIWHLQVYKTAWLVLKSWILLYLSVQYSCTESLFHVDIVQQTTQNEHPIFSYSLSACNVPHSSLTSFLPGSNTYRGTCFSFPFLTEQNHILRCFLVPKIKFVYTSTMYILMQKQITTHVDAPSALEYVTYQHTWNRTYIPGWQLTLFKWDTMSVVVVVMICGSYSELFSPSFIWSSSIFFSDTITQSHIKQTLKIMKPIRSATNCFITISNMS